MLYLDPVFYLKNKRKTAERAPLIDLNVECLKPVTELADNFFEYHNWRAENFVFARRHDKFQNIFVGKDGRTLLVKYNQRDGEFWSDEYWDLYQGQDDGRTTVRSLTLTEHPIGRDESIRYIFKSVDGVLDDATAAIIAKEMKISSPALEFDAMRKNFKAEGDRMFGRNRLYDVFHPGGAVQEQGAAVVSALPQDIFANGETDAQTGKEKYDTFLTWWRESKMINSRDQHHLITQNGRTFDATDSVYYDSENKFLMMFYTNPDFENDPIRYHRIYEMGNANNIIRTTFTTREARRYSNKYTVSVKSTVVKGAAEVQRVKMEEAFAVNAAMSFDICEILQDDLEALTEGVSYKAAALIPS